MKRRILLFAKLPRVGSSKTRLAPALGLEGAARLSEALLDDTLARLRALGPPVELHVTPPTPDELDWFRDRYPSVPVRDQRGEDLGERLARAFGASFDGGDDAVMAVGSDHPTLPLSYLRRGFEALAERDAVMGPGRDGGYYALGIRAAAWPAARRLFRDVPWSTSRVARVTRRSAEVAGLDLAGLPEWYDVDRPRDLERLRRDASPEGRSLRTLERLADDEPEDVPEPGG
jgi:rSAM/selenodomain-associated transferase 1